MIEENLPAAGPTAGSWKVVLAFTLLYLSWGTTYFAIRLGVHTYHLPPALFGGTRVAAAGLVLLLFLRWRGMPLVLTRRQLLTTFLGSVILFVGGNGLINVALERVPSGLAAALVATTPLWMALMESSWPRGEKLTARGWLGLLAGFGGLLLLLRGQVNTSDLSWENVGPYLVIGSAMCWAFGSLILRHGATASAHLTAAAYQMVFGGVGLSLVGLVLGEGTQLNWDMIQPGAVGAYLYLLVVGSLVGFVSYNWLLGQVSPSLVGTYAYVNPVVALIVGWALGGESLTGAIVAGMAVILAGVAMVRGAVLRSSAERLAPLRDDPPVENVANKTRMAQRRACVRN